MKKYISITIFLFLLILLVPNTVHAADLELPYSEWGIIYSQITVVWHDFGDAANTRPTSITIPFEDDSDSTNNPTFTLNKADCEVTDLGDGVRTSWTGVVRLPATNSNLSNPKYQIKLAQNDIFETDYKCISSSGYVEYMNIGATGAEGVPFKLELWPAALYQVEHTIKVVYEDGDDRDRNRSFIDKYQIIADGTAIENNVTFSRADNYTITRVLDIYQTDALGVANLNAPISYSLESQNKDFIIVRPDGSQTKYNFRLEQDGYNITLYASYVPHKLSYDIPVSIDYGTDTTHTKPTSVDVKLMTSQAEYQTIALNNGNSYTNKFSDAYLNDKDGSVAVYNVSIDNTSDWEFTTTGNQEDGFVIKAKYIGRNEQAPAGNNSANDGSDEKIVVPDMHTGGSPYDLKVLNYFIIGYVIIIMTAIVFVFRKKK